MDDERCEVETRAARSTCGSEHGGVRCTLPVGHDGRHVWKSAHCEVSWTDGAPAVRAAAGGAR